MLWWLKERGAGLVMCAGRSNGVRKRTLERSYYWMLGIGIFGNEIRKRNEIEAKVGWKYEEITVLL